jgi:hypothetical protein
MRGTYTSVMTRLAKHSPLQQLLLLCETPKYSVNLSKVRNLRLTHYRSAHILPLKYDYITFKICKIRKVVCGVVFSRYVI